MRDLVSKLDFSNLPGLLGGKSAVEGSDRVDRFDSGIRQGYSKLVDTTNKLTKWIWIYYYRSRCRNLQRYTERRVGKTILVGDSRVRVSLRLFTETMFQRTFKASQRKAQAARMRRYWAEKREESPSRS